jgi:hypothetical protein
LTGNQRLDVPDTLRILVNATITAEETHARHTRDTLADPLVLVLVGFVNESLGLIVAVEIIRDEVVVAVLFDGPDQSCERAGISKRVLLDGLKDGLEVRIKGVGAVVVCMAKILHILGQVTEEEDVVLANFTGDFDLRLSAEPHTQGLRPLTFAPSHVPIIKPPLRTNFMFEVPLASVPAVEMCSLISLAGIIISALETL